MLVLRGMKLTKDKLHALELQYPANSADITAYINQCGYKGESDFIALVKDRACVSIEVKRTDDHEAVRKAQEQHTRTETFVGMVCKIVDASFALPVYKVLTLLQFGYK